MVGFWEAYKYGERGDASGALARGSQEARGKKIREESYELRKQTGETASENLKRLNRKDRAERKTQKRKERLEDEERIEEVIKSSNRKEARQRKASLAGMKNKPRPKLVGTRTIRIKSKGTRRGSVGGV